MIVRSYRERDREEKEKEREREGMTEKYKLADTKTDWVTKRAKGAMTNEILGLYLFLRLFLSLSLTFYLSSNLSLSP